MQLSGMVEIKRPVPFKSRLDTWRAQAQAQFLGVNYIVSHCATQQPIGLGIPVLLTSFEDGQAILFTGKPDQKFGLTQQEMPLRFSNLAWQLGRLQQYRQSVCQI